MPLCALAPLVTFLGTLSRRCRRGHPHHLRFLYQVHDSHFQNWPLLTFIQNSHKRIQSPPGNRTRPVIISAKMHPTDQMSTVKRARVGLVSLRALYRKWLPIAINQALFLFSSLLTYITLFWSCLHMMSSFMVTIQCLHFLPICAWISLSCTILHPKPIKNICRSIRFCPDWNESICTIETTDFKLIW